MPYYRNLGWSESDFPLAENYYKQCLTLPIFPDLGFKNQQFIINKIDEFYKNE